MVFTSLVASALHTRVKFFEDLLEDHKLSMKKGNEELFGVNIPFLRLIANGQIFNKQFIHPMDKLEEANNDSAKCQELLEEWIKEAGKVTP